MQYRSSEIVWRCGSHKEQALLLSHITYTCLVYITRWRCFLICLYILLIFHLSEINLASIRLMNHFKYYSFFLQFKIQTISQRTIDAYNRIMLVIWLFLIASWSSENEYVLIYIYIDKMSLKQHGHFATNGFVFPLFRQMLIDHSYCQAWSALLAAAILKMHFDRVVLKTFYLLNAPHHCVEHSRGRILTSATCTLYIYIYIYISIIRIWYTTENVTNEWLPIDDLRLMTNLDHFCCPIDYSIWRPAEVLARGLWSFIHKLTVLNTH